MLQVISPSLQQYIARNSGVQETIQGGSQVSKNYTNKVSLEMQSDTFVNSQKVAKEAKKTKNKKILKGVAIGVGVAALVTGGIILAKKISSKSVKQLAEKIDFKNADSLEEAIQFGKEHLGIKKYKGFANSDLDIINWINEGLVDVNNATKGKAVVPKIVSYVDDISAVGVKEGKIVGGSMSMNGHLKIPKSMVQDTKEALEEILSAMVKKEDLPKALEKMNSSKNFSQIEGAIEKLSKKNNIDVAKLMNKGFICPKDIVYHEMGHLQHSNNVASELYLGLRKEAEIKASKTIVTSEAQNLRKLFESEIDVVKSISDYAGESPCEFVAECYPRLVVEKLTGKKLLSNEALELYKKFGGAMI